MIKFMPATREQLALKLALYGTSGSGKSWTALQIATILAAYGKAKIAAIDTEGKSLRKYAGSFTFDVVELRDHNPQLYMDAIQSAEKAGYDVLIIDSLSHAWNGMNGTLEVVDKAGAKMKDNKFAGWSTGRPLQNKFVRTILDANIHIIGTMRAKTEWAMEIDDRTGKTKPVKVGVGAVQSDSFEYEFDVVGLMQPDHSIDIVKTRCPDLDNSQITDIPHFVGVIHAWLTDGVEPPKWYENNLDMPSYTEWLEREGLGEELAYLTSEDFLDKYSGKSALFDAVNELIELASVEGTGHPPPVVDEDGELFSHAAANGTNT